VYNSVGSLSKYNKRLATVVGGVAVTFVATIVGDSMVVTVEV
jgi:hypothetical protein